MLRPGSDSAMTVYSNSGNALAVSTYALVRFFAFRTYNPLCGSTENNRRSFAALKMTTQVGSSDAVVSPPIRKLRYVSPCSVRPPHRAQRTLRRRSAGAAGTTARRTLGLYKRNQLLTGSSDSTKSIFESRRKPCSPFAKARKDEHGVSLFRTTRRTTNRMRYPTAHRSGRNNRPKP
jgi:hypothetical protein